jgi:hypothetical protein
MSGRGSGAARLQFVDELLSSDAGLTGARRAGQWSTSSPVTHRARAQARVSIPVASAGLVSVAHRR